MQVHPFRRGFLLALAAPALLAFDEAPAQESPVTSPDSLRTTAGAAPASNFQPNRKPVLTATRTQGAIHVDGELDDPGWQGAARAGNFTRWNPQNMEKPDVDTEALVTYDDANLYVGFLVEDDPQAVRATLRDRDQMFQDDFVGLFIDTYGDGSWAYEIWSNPVGVQGDILWTPDDEDELFDMVYESRGKVTPRGYQVEMAIPFSSLRFPDRAEQSWRVDFWRNHPRDRRNQYSWAAIPRQEPCWQCQWGTLTGIRDVKPGGSLELLPSLTASHSSELRNSDDFRSGLHDLDPDADASLNLKYKFASNLTGEAAVNPDFSQIEADVAQIDVNTTFALDFPEKRPFFLEGSDLFQTWVDAVYTRTINDPVAAARFTGRRGRTSVAYIGARDEHSPILLPFEERSEFLSGGESVSNILRIKHTFQQESNAGLLITDRRYDGGGSGTVYGADALIRLFGNYRFEGQLLGSHTHEPEDSVLTADLGTTTFDRDEYTARFDGETFAGDAAYASFERDGQHWNFDFDFWQWSPTFRADNGFVTQNDNRRGLFWTGYTARPKGLADEIQPNVQIARVWNYAGVRKDEWVRPELFMRLKGQTTFIGAFLWSRERFRDEVFPGIRRGYAYVESNFSDPVRLGIEVESGRFIARNLDPSPVLGRGTVLTTWGTIKPMQRFVLEPRFVFSTLSAPDGGPKIFDAYIARTRAQYQFTRELFFRAVLQYTDRNRRTDLSQPMERRKALELDPLLSYKLNPFTVAYIGSTHDFLDDDLTVDAEGKGGFASTGRQFFFKIQYLVRV